VTFVVITNSADVHADFLVRAAERESVELVRINTDHIRQRGEVFWASDGGSLYSVDGREIRFADAKVVYSRRPRAATLDAEDWAERFINKEWDHLDAALCDAATLCINPLVAERAKNRLIQLRVAREAGLSVPETLISTSASKLREFASGRRCITKGINNSYVRHQGRIYSAFTQTVETDDLVEYESGVPTLLQAYIRPCAYWRVVTLLERLFAFRHVGAALEADVDSRRVELQLEGQQAELPESIAHGLSRMRSRLHYNFASSDFVEDAEGRLWFLDLNPSGQWAFLEERFDVPLSHHFVRLAR
jgi:hypothetical protein